MNTKISGLKAAKHLLRLADSALQYETYGFPNSTAIRHIRANIQAVIQEINHWLEIKEVY